MIRATVNTKDAKAKLEALKKALTIEAMDAVVEQAAFETQARLIRSTPKRWFGQVRRAWVIAKPAPGVRQVINISPVMKFLEDGTKPHGPKTEFGPLLPGQPRKKKALYIPLTRRAVAANEGATFGKVDQYKVKGETYWESKAALFQKTETVRKGKRKVATRALIFGQDYVLAKRVKGITAMHIAAKQRPIARSRIKFLMREFVRKAIAAK